MTKWKGILAATTALLLAMMPATAFAAEVSGGLGGTTQDTSKPKNSIASSSDGLTGSGSSVSGLGETSGGLTATSSVTATTALSDTYLAPAASNALVQPLYPFVGTAYNTTVGYSMPYLVGIDTTNQVVTVVKRGDDGQYNIPVKHFLCSTGKASSKTPAGLHVLSDAGRPEWSYFKTPKCWVRYPVHIYGNYFLHSLVYSRQDLSTRTSSSYRDLGSPASNGCIRLMDEDAQWLSNNVFGGTVIEVYAGMADPTLNATLKAMQP